MRTITVKMTRDESGSVDGVNVRRYYKGKSYDLPEDLAGVFIAMKCAKRAKEITQKPKLETPEG